jgi:phosphate starvation-inducible protein PhoH
MERSIPVGGREELTKLFGTYDRNLKEIKKATGVDVTVRNGDLHHPAAPAPPSTRRSPPSSA